MSTLAGQCIMLYALYNFVRYNQAYPSCQETGTSRSQLSTLKVFMI